MSKQQDQIDALLKELTPKLEAEFRQALINVQSGVIIERVIELLEVDDVEGAMRLLNLDEDSFQMYFEALRNVMIGVGVIVAASIPRLKDPRGQVVVYRFNPRDPTISNWLETHVGSVISGVMDAINENVRDTIASGKLINRSAKAIAYDIFGVWNSKTNTRDGSVFALSKSQTKTVLKVQRALLSNSLEGKKHYLTLKRRNPAFDSWVEDSIKDEKVNSKISVNEASIIVTTLKESYAALRNEMLQRTQAGTISSNTKHEVYHQSLRKASAPDSAIERIWDSINDADTRYTHQALDGQIRNGMDQPFQSVSGALLRFPRDMSLGAGLDEVAGCRCHQEYRYLAGPWL